MKCAACGYEYAPKKLKVDKAIRFKSGPKKGQVKEVTEEIIDISIGDEEFKELSVSLSEPKDRYPDYSSRSPLYEETLYACPKCGTLRVGRV